MVITFEDWKIKKSHGINVYDLFIVNKTKKGDLVDNPFAYGIGIERCVHIIVQERLDKNNDEIDLNKFLESYKKEVKILIQQLNEFNLNK